MLPVLTAEEVADILAEAGFQAAESDGYRAVTPGFSTCTLPVSFQDRVAVTWHLGWGSPSGDAVHDPYATPLAACAVALDEEGYKTEFVADFPCGYLVVWITGEF
jgi:hypothetical protein